MSDRLGSRCPLYTTTTIMTSVSLFDVVSINWSRCSRPWQHCRSRRPRRQEQATSVKVQACLSTLTPSKRKKRRSARAGGHHSCGASVTTLRASGDSASSGGLVWRGYRRMERAIKIQRQPFPRKRLPLPEEEKMFFLFYLHSTLFCLP